MIMSIKTLAKECLEYLVTKTRTNGDSFVCFKDDRPDWMQTLARKSHADQLPNDFRYDFIESALTALANHNDLDDARDSIEADIYTSELTAWLHSRNDRLEYVNEAVSELGHSKTIDGDLMLGQLWERQEVFSLVVEYLESIDDETEETA
jgi:hypothetical protein